MGTEQEVVALANDLASFESGYTDAPTETPASAPVQQVEAAPEQVDPIKALTERLEKLQKGYDTLAGNFGGVQRTHQELQNALAARESATRIMSDAAVAAPAQAQHPKANDLDAIVDAKVKERVAHIELNREVPGWMQELKSDDFKKWQAANPTLWKDSDDPGEVAQIVRTYRASKQPATPAVKPNAARTTRIAAAVAPRGAGGHSGGSSAADEMNAGYSSSS